MVMNGEWSTKLLDFKDVCISKIRLDGYLDVVMGTAMFWLRGVFTEATHEAMTLGVFEVAMTSPGFC